METKIDNESPSTWDAKFDAVAAAPMHHKVLFENEKLRVLEVTLEPQDEEPMHHHRWPSVIVLDEFHDKVSDIAPDGAELPRRRDKVQAVNTCLVMNMVPQPLGRVLNEGDTNIHGIRVEIKD